MNGTLTEVVTKLLMMADYLADPVWLRAANDKAMGMVSLDSLPISEPLKIALRQWARWFDEFGQHQGRDEISTKRWINEGRVLCTRLTDELGPAYDVKYESGI